MARQLSLSTGVMPLMCSTFTLSSRAGVTSSGHRWLAALFSR